MYTIIIILAYIPLMLGIYLAAAGVNVPISALIDPISFFIVPLCPYLITVGIFKSFKLNDDALNFLADLCIPVAALGTLIGLIFILGSMANPPAQGVDPLAKIGGSIAVALITMLYGVFTKYLIIKPILGCRKYCKT